MLQPSQHVPSKKTKGDFTFLLQPYKNCLFFRMKSTLLCSFCNKEAEAPLHNVSECTSVIYLWRQLANFFEAI